MGLVQQEQNRLCEIVDIVVKDTPRGSMKNKLNNPWYYAFCKYFNEKFKCGGYLSDEYAQDIIEIFELGRGASIHHG